MWNTSNTDLGPCGTTTYQHLKLSGGQGSASYPAGGRRLEQSPDLVVVGRGWLRWLLIPKNPTSLSALRASGSLPCGLRTLDIRFLFHTRFSPFRRVVVYPHRQWRRSVVKSGVKVSQVKPSNCFRLHPDTGIVLNERKTCMGHEGSKNL